MHVCTRTRSVHVELRLESTRAMHAITIDDDGLLAASAHPHPDCLPSQDRAAPILRLSVSGCLTLGRLDDSMRLDDWLPPPLSAC